MEEKHQRCRRCHGGILQPTLNHNERKCNYCGWTRIDRPGLFPRFIASSIFSNWTYSDGVQNYEINDFRVILIDMIIDLGIDAIRSSIYKEREYNSLFNW
jgi:hypothetical protein